jgi:hypothetical protein
VRALVLTLVLMTGWVGRGQNYLKNPDFEQPLGADNWTVEYEFGGPSDFSVHDRTTIAHKDKVPGTWDGAPNYLDVYGAEFSPYHDGWMRAYFKQVVGGLKPGSNYVATCWITQFVDKYTNNVKVYLETVGGPLGTVTNASPYVYTYCNNNPSNWTRCSVSNRASNTGEIEVRLRFTKQTWTTLAWQYIRAYYDHASLMLPGQTPPPFRMVSLAVPNPGSLTLKWETVMNNTYDLESKTGFGPGPWWTFQSGLLATGTNLTFTTEWDLLPSVPQSFRAVSHNYVP